MLTLLRGFKSKVVPKLVLNRTPLDQQIDNLRAEITMLKKERDDLERFKESTVNGRHANRMLHHSPIRKSGTAAIVPQLGTPIDFSLVDRVARAYRGAVRTPIGSTDSMWLTAFAEKNSATHETLERGDIDAIGSMLRDPGSSMLFFGFDNLQSADAALRGTDGWIQWLHLLTYDSLLQTCRAIGARRLEYPEAGVDFDEAPHVEELLEELDAAFGFRIDFPNPFAGEIGIQTSRGIASYRAAQALFQAYRIRQLAGKSSDANVMEIGAGLGRTAYYAVKMGVARYTIIDIPLTGVAQGYYLGRVLGENAVSLFGEVYDAKVRVLPPVAYRQLDETFNLIVNVDSLTEMASTTAFEYLQGARRLTHQFLSINHEHNSFTVQSLYRLMPNIKAWRSPYWLRRGYVEELIEFTDAGAPDY